MGSVGNPFVWGIFAAIIAIVLIVDLGIFHRKAHVVTFREAVAWSLVWLSLALAFNVFVYFKFGTNRALEFLQAYLIEEALSVDNLFVFLAVFSYFSVPERLQHRVLFWGILGALIMRGAFIWTGLALISRFHWVMYVFGAFLVITAVRLLFAGDEDVDLEKNPVLRIFKRFVPMTKEYVGTQFLVRRDGRLLATPLLLVLVVVEATDVVFAVDSIPAVFAVTQDVFIVYTSNIFAILGLRTLCFVLSSLMRTMRYLKVGLSVVLAFVGVKMLLGDHVKIPQFVSLAVIGTVLVGTAIVSVMVGRKDEDKPAGS